MRGSKLVRKLMKTRTIWIKDRKGWKAFEIGSFEFRNDKLIIITKNRTHMVFLEDVIGFWKERYKI